MNLAKMEEDIADVNALGKKRFAALGRTVVGMNEGVIIRVRTHESNEQQQELWTFGLGGCIAVVVYAEMSDGSFAASLSRFDPMHTLEHADFLKMTWQELNPARVVTRTFMDRAMASADPYRHDMFSLCIHRDLLATQMLVLFGNDADAQAIAYDSIMSGYDGRHDVSLQIHSESGKRATLTWWGGPQEHF